MEPYETLSVQDHGAVRLLTLNQPQRFNPLDFASGPELARALEDAQAAAGVGAVVLTGAGKAFAAGGDVRQMRDIVENGGDIRRFFSDLAYILAKTTITLRRLRLPVIAAINGVAAGGGLAWALAADLALAAEGVRFDPAYIRIAVCPDGGASAIVPRLIGHKRASEFFLLGRAIDAATARDWGLINQVVAPAELLPRALEAAERLAQAPAQALARTKALLNQAVFGDLEVVLENERQGIMDLCGQPDFAEGLRAFFEKRPTRFNQGRP
ncbi:Enoyl-CoA hydratase/isomerase [Desulfarculus baarsii DSM 2075]|uniref:Enoyl-CoA hydratase/isomerase n=1 Tax=Desulfarculus baarsii (strain ATCC 33931 / DSM 2075 / LMG 7858 / VKM B-1802 / 2st14) TaxID=644282 RepID=E1QEQ6_DESB2|nr:enoyl-CoA hydratase/isomerase family protein [Desulfarculus baarsii]ADK84042.1 Enoyl-CoA hydratase/isomerase [Desulfarculus baarsii DSM 2075]